MSDGLLIPKEKWQIWEEITSKTENLFRKKNTPFIMPCIHSTMIYIYYLFANRALTCHYQYKYTLKSFLMHRNTSFQGICSSPYPSNETPPMRTENKVPNFSIPYMKCPESSTENCNKIHRISIIRTHALAWIQWYLMTFPRNFLQKAKWEEASYYSQIPEKIFYCLNIKIISS